MPQREINYDELGEIEDAYHGVRAALSPELSNVYVPGEGSDDGEIIAFVIGEAPGARETLTKRPFVGPAGVVLRELMGLAGLFNSMMDGADMLQNIVERGAPEWRHSKGNANAWITNVLKFRPPRNRNPTDNEIKSCAPLIRREWVAVGKPNVIIPVGAIALQCITGRKQSIMKVSGRCTTYYSRRSKMDIHVWPMVHPSFGLRPQGKAMRPVFEQDWERLGEWFNGT